MSRAIPQIHHAHPTPLWAVGALTFLASIGTGVVWNGISFIAKHDYGFSEFQTLWLYAMMGGTYVIGALSTGRALRSLEQLLSPRSVLGLILCLEALTCVSLWFVHRAWMLWVVAAVMSVLSSWVWPIVESYLTAGRHGESMRNAIGWWNLTWTAAVAVALVMMMPVMKEQPDVLHIGGTAIRLEPRLAIVVLGLLHAVALLPLMRFGRFPGAHDEHLSSASIQPEYPYLLHAARLLLPLSYLLNSTMSPLLPYLFERIELQQELETTIASTWMWMRIIAMAIMWRVGFWHGRWGTLLLGGAAMTLGFAVAIMAAWLPIFIVGLALFGTGMGIVYYAALYYAMSVGRAEVDAGGTHEALIGVGYTVGPITGLVGVSATSAAREAGVQVWDGAILVTIVCLLIAAAAIAVVRPYLKARRLRRGS